MIETQDDQLIFRFPDVHPDAICRVEFQRTLRIPDDDQIHHLPPGLGRFPLEHTDDHSTRLPSDWGGHGGVVLPMYQAEALWISFGWLTDYPCAIKVAAGKINALTGEAWTDGLRPEPQDYLVVPTQPWLDGFGVGSGVVRQFVAMPLGEGYTAEEQLTGVAEHGGLQLLVCPFKRERWLEVLKQREARARLWQGVMFHLAPPHSLGLAPGGRMRQQIYRDPNGLDAWEVGVSSRCFVHLLNSEQWRDATGKQPPGQPPSAEAYTRAGLPWFDYYDEQHGALAGAARLAVLQSVAAKKAAPALHSPTTAPCRRPPLFRCTRGNGCVVRTRSENPRR